MYLNNICSIWNCSSKLHYVDLFSDVYNKIVNFIKQISCILTVCGVWSIPYITQAHSYFKKSPSSWGLVNWRLVPFM